MTAHPLSPVCLGRPLSLADFAAVVFERRPVVLTGAERAAVARCRQAVERLHLEGDRAPRIYGMNTGFGALSETAILPDQIRELQHNLLRSHSSGTGPLAPPPLVRGMLLLRAQTLALAHSGVRPELIDLLAGLLNQDILPRVPVQGSVGASGDLAPLAHLGLALIGEGEVDVAGVVSPSRAALERAGLVPIELASKEGLALINGTQYMTAAGLLVLLEAEQLLTGADIAGAMSLEALKGSHRPFDERLMAVRPHPGQAEVARNLRTLLAHSELMESHKDCGRVQDAYSLRCMPQVHGASRDALGFAKDVLAREMNSVTDNPIVFVGEQGAGDVVSGGNFHGQPLAYVLDLAAIALAELSNISERRVEHLLNPTLSQGLTPFLAQKSGLHSGFMIAQVTAASLVSENKVLCHPSSIDSIPSSAGKEDHVSMGSVGARKLGMVVENVRRGLAIEVMTAAAGLDQRLPLRAGAGVAAAHEYVRRHVPPLAADRPLTLDIERVAELLRTGALGAAVGAAVGPLV